MNEASPCLTRHAEQALTASARLGFPFKPTDGIDMTLADKLLGPYAKKKSEIESLNRLQGLISLNRMFTLGSDF